jgi:hypothetical protein
MLHCPKKKMNSHSSVLIFSFSYLRRLLDFEHLLQLRENVFLIFIIAGFFLVKSNDVVQALSRNARSTYGDEKHVRKNERNHFRADEFEFQCRSNALEIDALANEHSMPIEMDRREQHNVTIGSLSIT